jgi:hypothetical protein
MPIKPDEPLLVVMGRRGERYSLVAGPNETYHILCDGKPASCASLMHSRVDHAVDVLLHMVHTGCLDSWCPYRYAGPCVPTVQARNHTTPAEL